MATTAAHTDRPCGMSDLPEEILLEIFEYLAYEDCARVKQVCRGWNRICGDIFTVFQPVGRNLVVIPSHVRTARVTHVTLHNSDVTDEILGNFARLVPNLRVFSIHNSHVVTGAGLKALVDVTKLRALTVDECKFLEGGALDKAVGTREIHVTLTTQGEGEGDGVRRARDVRPGSHVIIERDETKIYGRALQVTHSKPGKGGGQKTMIVYECLRTKKKYETVMRQINPVPTFLLTRRELECIGHVSEDVFLFINSRGDGVERELKGNPDRLDELREDITKWTDRPENQALRVSMMRFGAEEPWYADRWWLVPAAK